MADFLDRFNEELAALSFAPPVAYVYNPLQYALPAYRQYLEKYGGEKPILMMGMNPGPWGMAQTGVPFGEVEHVRDWLKIACEIGRPEVEHPSRPVLGLDCERSEVSGRRLWGYLKERFGEPSRLAERLLVANYCPLLFLEQSGRNRTPDKLPRVEREPLLAACDRAMGELLKLVKPRLVIGVGKWAEERARNLVESTSLGAEVAGVPHPSPANPAANRGWGAELGKLLDRFDT